MENKRKDICQSCQTEFYLNFVLLSYLEFFHSVFNYDKIFPHFSIKSSPSANFLCTCYSKFLIVGMLSQREHVIRFFLHTDLELILEKLYQFICLSAYFQTLCQKYKKFQMSLFLAFIVKS